VRGNGPVCVCLQRLFEHFGKSPRLHDIPLPANLNFAAEQFFEQFHS
jgi:hypothetical protein